jgi:glycosyltransferase involved in cell wall biosynthesis
MALQGCDCCVRAVTFSAVARFSWKVATARNMAGVRTIVVMGRVLDQRDGLGLYCLNLLRHMIAQDAGSRYVVLLRTPAHSGSFRVYPNASTEVLPSRSKLWWDQVTVLRAARRVQADLIFNPKFSVPFLWRRGCAFVLQDSDWYVNPRNYPWWDLVYIRLLLPLYCHKATRLLVISQSTLTDLVRHGVIRAGKAQVTHAAVGANFSPVRDEGALQRFRAAYGLPEAFILTATRAYHTGNAGSQPYPGGNNERLVRAYRLYRQRGGGLPLVVAGHRVEEYLRGKGFTGADLAGVHFIGFVPNSEMHLAYQLAECFVLVKLCESFGLPILEALASGCPAIVPKTCASPEVAGDAARLVDPYDEEDIAGALLEVGGSVSVRMGMRERGLVRARDFSWGETARRTLAVLNEMTAGAAELSAPRAQSHR